MTADYYYTVSGHAVTELTSTPSHRTDYEFLVVFKSREDNKETHENFLKWYWSWDESRDGHPYHYFSDEVCAVALATFFLRAQWKRLADGSPQYAPGSTVPNREPDFQDAGHRLWMLKEAKSDIYTESNAGWDLYMECLHSKRSVSDAKSFVHAKFNGQSYVWDKVLTHFRKNGGRHTEKYLRVDH